MNPEEGEIRPQLQDRFGLCAEIHTLSDPDMRMEIVERYLDFESNPKAFRARWSKAEKAQADNITRARRLLPKISPDKNWFRAAVELSLSLAVHGHRADILMIKAAATLAALAGRGKIESADFETAATLVYPHRIKRLPFEEGGISAEELRDKARSAIKGNINKKKA